MNTYTIAAFYNFVSIEKPQELADKLRIIATNNAILGTAILAHEGINGTVCGSIAAIEELKKFFISNDLFQSMIYKEDLWDSPVFEKLKIKVKPEIVTLRHSVDPACHRGQYLNWNDWNALLVNPEALIIDTRNDFEFQTGTFKNAVNPETERFSQIMDSIKSNPGWQTYKKIGMFCTGGVRCEKSTALLLKLGFTEVFHLKGGIIQYLKDVPRENNLWTGQCYVFDKRICLPWSYYHPEQNIRLDNAAHSQ